MNSNKNVLYAFALLVVLVLGGLGIYYLPDYINDSEEDVNEITTIEEVSDNQIEYSISVLETDETESVYNLQGEENTSVYNVLTLLDIQDDSFSMTTQEESFGVFITQMNSLQPDPSSEFITFLVNGEPATVGISDYKLMDGDVITFKIESFI